MTKPNPGRTKRYVEWGVVRNLFEKGGPEVTYSSLARDGWASRPEISKKAKEQSWRKPDPKSNPEMLAEVAKRADAMANAKPVVGEVLPPEGDPAATAAAQAVAVDSQIDQRVHLVDRHRREWNSPRKRIYDGLQAGDFEKLKQGKIAAEALTLIQNGERKAWGLDGDPTMILKVISPSKRDLNDD